jgi:hypothetical protein
VNFRLDLSRLHAEWLIEQKSGSRSSPTLNIEYAEALLWDQLRNAMKHAETNPLPGFEEGPIDFPPTFKYDVRSVPGSSAKSIGLEVCQSDQQGNTKEFKEKPVGCQGTLCGGSLSQTRT